MGARRLLDYDPLTGVKSFHQYHDDTDTFTIETEQDCAPILDHNKALKNEGVNKKSDMWHAASIPMTVQMEWLTKHGVDLHNRDHWDGVKRLLNSSDYSHLRTGHFRL